MRSLRLQQGRGAAATARQVGIARHQLHYLESGYRTLRPANTALLLKALDIQGTDLAWWGSLIETLVSTLSLKELQALNSIDPRHVEAVA